MHPLSVFLALLMAYSVQDIPKYQTNTYQENVYYVAGQLPCVIAVPHGGLRNPSAIPDRQFNDSALLADAYTMNIALGVAAKLKSHYQLDPHVVACEISRHKVDVNRPLDLGAETEGARTVWNEYHGFLQKAVRSVVTRHQNGLLIDLQGHAHRQGLVELGYLVDKLNLIELSDEKLNEMILTQSSIQTLAQRFHWIEPIDLLRNRYSFGKALQTSQVSVIPSPAHPFPSSSAPYFRGGYTTRTYHGNTSRSGMDCIQIEMPRQLRFSKQGRKDLIDSISIAVIYMLDRFYIDQAKL